MRQPENGVVEGLRWCVSCVTHSAYCVKRRFRLPLCGDEPSPFHYLFSGCLLLRQIHQTLRHAVDAACAHGEHDIAVLQHVVQ